MNIALDAPPEPDCAEGAPHPRFATQVLGQDAARAGFLEAFNAQRLHHAWLLTGPPGIGKATLAWQIARFLLDQPVVTSGGLFDAPPPHATDLSADRDGPRARRISALSEPALFLLRRPWDQKKKALSAQISVDAVRGLKRFFTYKASDDGRRVVIVDCADELNNAAANALLKMLEEPPANTVFVLISHMPSRLLPTIRSRCRRLSCAPLGNADLAAVLRGIHPDINDADLAALTQQSAGSAGKALRLHIHNGIALQRELVGLFRTMPGLDHYAALSLAGRLAARGAQDQRALLLTLVEEVLAALAIAGSLGPTDADTALEPTMIARLAATPAAGRAWAQAQSEVTAHVYRGLEVNLDPQALILDMLLKIDKVAAECAAN